MTTIIILAIIAILLLIIVIQFGVFLSRNYNSQIGVDMKLSAIDSNTRSILNEIARTNGRIDGFIPAFKKLLEHNESIENFWAADSSLVIKLLKELVDIEHKSDERNDNMFPFMQEIMRNYNPPCYSPDGICTNPQMDCINCPKRGTGGTWSTNILTKAEDTAFQEKFNDNKE